MIIVLGRKGEPMDDLISRQASLAVVKHTCETLMQKCDHHYDAEVGDDVFDNIKEVDAILSCNKYINMALKALPSVEAEPVRYGHWYIQRFGSDAKCSECGMSFTDAYDIENHDKYCRHCGARMLGIAVKEWK